MKTAHRALALAALAFTTACERTVDERGDPVSGSAPPDAVVRYADPQGCAENPESGVAIAQANAQQIEDTTDRARALTAIKFVAARAQTQLLQCDGQRSNAPR
jgi:hypothetical protein